MKGERHVPTPVAARRAERTAQTYPLYAISLAVIATCLIVLITHLLMSIIEGAPFPVLKDPLLFWASFALIGGGIGIVGLAWRRARLNRPPGRGLRVFVIVAACIFVPATLFEIVL
ncbi:hypothetical protein [Oceaniglobus indicus]|uniref:hypothetical protein n=1 Tax=Oceaniglobus indicus TaxID=2047749 RepID=UPI000C1790D3|nr:hypothetical protein [Oceaniglobus indicus]